VVWFKNLTLGGRWNLVWLVLWGVAFSALPVFAECSPSQMQEADLAYSGAYEFMKTGTWEQAVPRLQSILEMCPEHINTLNALAMAYKELEKYEEAKLVFEKMIAAKGEQVEGVDYGNYGSVLARLKLYPEARAAYIRAYSLAPDDCGILFNLGMLHMAVQDYRQSVETLEAAFAKCEAYRGNISTQLADACEKAALKEEKIGNVDKAAYYREKYREYAQQGAAKEGYELVKKLMAEQKYSEAVPVLQGILEKEPDHTPSLLTLARCYAALKQHASAIPYYERYLALKEDDEDATGELVLSYVEVGQCQNGTRLASEARTRFEAKGQQYMAPLYYAWGKSLECAQRYGEAKEKFRAATNCGVPKWTQYSRAEMDRMDQFLRIEELKKQRDNQGG
jgi:tetratricopeptide (TPR) repeat protein